jgi:hypothetical protein
LNRPWLAWDFAHLVEVPLHQSAFAQLLSPPLPFRFLPSFFLSYFHLADTYGYQHDQALRGWAHCGK